MRYEVVKRSIIGKRDEQQDALDYFSHNGWLCAVLCDGMGGMQYGASASKIAIQTFRQNIEEADTKSQSIPQVLLECVDILDESVCSITDEDGKSTNAGSTIVAVVIQGNNVYWLSVGDSRLYIHRGQEMLQVTRDHNYSYTVDQLFQSGKISQSQYEEHIQKGDTLTSYLGMGGIEFMDICRAPFSAKEGDSFLLVSDGVYKALDQKMLQQVICAQMELAEKAERILEMVESRNLPNQDNTSFIIIEAVEEEK